jgi:hypothetical protein
MSMDALTDAALASLAKEIIPKLHKQLGALLKLPPDARAADGDLGYLINEA